MLVTAYKLNSYKFLLLINKSYFINLLFFCATNSKSLKISLPEVIFLEKNSRGN